MFNMPALRVTVITVPRGAEAMRDGLATRPWITPIVMNRPHDLPDAVRQLRHQGVRQLSCIGGRTLARQLIDARLIQDLYLTTSAQSGGEPRTPFYDAPLRTTPIARKHGTGADRGVVFEHLRIRRGLVAVRAPEICETGGRLNAPVTRRSSLPYLPFATSLISNSLGHHLPVMNSRSCAAS